MPLKIHTLIRHVGCAACTVVEENYLDLRRTVGLMNTVGVLIQEQAQKVHGPVRIHNFSLAKGIEGWDSEVPPASPSTMFGNSSHGTGWSLEDEEPQPADEPANWAPGGPVEPASGEDTAGGGNDDDADDDDDDDDDDADAKEGAVKTTIGKQQPGLVYNITAVIDWSTPPANRDALADMDLLQLHDDERRQVEEYLRFRGARDLIVLEYHLET